MYLYPEGGLPEIRIFWLLMYVCNPHTNGNLLGSECSAKTSRRSEITWKHLNNGSHVTLTRKSFRPAFRIPTPINWSALQPILSYFSFLEFNNSWSTFSYFVEKITLNLEKSLFLSPECRLSFSSLLFYEHLIEVWYFHTNYYRSLAIDRIDNWRWRKRKR